MQVRIFLLIIMLVCQQCVLGKKVAHLKDFARPGEDVTQVLQNLINRYKTVVIDEGEWLISDEIRLRSNITIKGISAEKSVLKRNDKSALRGIKLFYTEKAKTDSYTKHDIADEFHAKRIKYKNICFENLTIDFNRSPKEFTHEYLTLRNLFGIALIHTSGGSVKNCQFKDMMTADCNNGSPAIVVYQSENIEIEGNSSEAVTLLKAIFSKNVSVSDNHCISSVGTAIEFIAGTKHQCINNCVDKVFWDVSCIGVNSTDCIIRANNVTASDENISCLTLGHEPVLFRADNAIVENNVLHSSGCRSIIIQNGCGIVLKNNICSSVINKDAPEMTSGSIVASGRAEGIHDIKLIDNTLSATGDGNRGCVTYRGTGKLLIQNNTITANRGVSILSKENCDVTITGNTIKSNDYAVTSGSSHLKVVGNSMTDGILSSSTDIDITDNQIEHTNHYTYLGTKWDKVVIERNQIVNSLDDKQPYVFLLNGSEKTASYDEGKVKVRGNVVKAEKAKNIISFSGNKSAPQLKRIKNVR